MRAFRPLVVILVVGTLVACGAGAPRVDVALSPVFDPAPRASSAAERPVVRTVASADAEEDIDTRVPAGACGPRDAAVRMDGRMLSETEAIPILLRRVLRDEVAQCAREAQQRDASMEGLLVLSFRMKAGGGIEATHVHPGAGDAALHRCVEAAFDAASTPEIVVGSISHFPLVLCGDGRVEWREPDGYR